MNVRDKFQAKLLDLLYEADIVHYDEMTLAIEELIQARIEEALSEFKSEIAAALFPESQR